MSSLASIKEFNKLMKKNYFQTIATDLKLDPDKEDFEKKFDTAKKIYESMVDQEKQMKAAIKAEKAALAKAKKAAREAKAERKKAIKSEITIDAGSVTASTETKKKSRAKTATKTKTKTAEAAKTTKKKESVKKDTDKPKTKRLTSKEKTVLTNVLNIDEALLNQDIYKGLSSEEIAVQRLDKMKVMGSITAEEYEDVLGALKKEIEKEQKRAAAKTKKIKVNSSV